MRFSGTRRTLFGAAAAQVISVYTANAIGNGSVVAPPLARFASVQISAAGGNGGSSNFSTGQDGGGGGQGGIVYANNIPVTGGHTYVYTLGATGNSSFWGANAIFGANSGGSPTQAQAPAAGNGGTCFGSFTLGQTGQSGEVGGTGRGQTFGVSGGAGGGPTGAPESLPGAGRNATGVGCGGSGGCSAQTGNPFPGGLGSGPQIQITWLG